MSSLITYDNSLSWSRLVEKRGSICVTSSVSVGGCGQLVMEEVSEVSEIPDEIPDIIKDDEKVLTPYTFPEMVSIFRFIQYFKDYMYT